MYVHDENLQRPDYLWTMRHTFFLPTHQKQLTAMFFSKNNMGTEGPCLPAKIEPCVPPER